VTALTYGYIERDGRVAVFSHGDPDGGVQVPGDRVGRDRPGAVRRLRTGDLATAHLHDRGFDVVGVDISPASIARAAERHPDCVFIAADVCQLSLPLRHFGLVTAFNCVSHISRRREAALFRR
jgi:SAM-dependent methyltransferase